MELQPIGHRIKQAREAARITQDQLCKAIGCTVQHISAIERGVKTPSLETFILIANTIGASSDLLLRDMLTNPVDNIACEYSAAASRLPRETQLRILKILRVLSEE